MERVGTAKLYWLSALTADDLAGETLDLEQIEAPVAVSRHDVFGTANFFNFAALAASTGLVNETGIEQIYAHNLELADRLVGGIDPSRYEIQPRGVIERRSAILFLRPLGRSSDDVGQRLSEAGVDVARRRGMIRVSPHFCNTVDDIERALGSINGV